VVSYMKKTSGFFSLLISTIFALGLMMHAVCAQIDSDGDGLSDEWEQGVGRYQVVDGSFTWEQANENAQARGGHLATFTSAAEWEAFLSLYGSSVLSETRIGMETSNTSPSGYRWVTDETGMFFNWAPEQPNGSFETTVVLYSYATGCVWHDFSTSNPFPYVLEFGYSTDPFNADTDGDGFNDKVESDNGSDPNNAASTPDLTDRDNDGVNYYREGKDGTDPNDPTSFNPLSVGLVAYYPFDGNANDESGYGHDGVVYNASLTSDRKSSPLSAYSFASASEKIETPSLPSLSSKSFTIAAWVYRTSSETFAAIFDQGASPEVNSRIQLQFRPDSPTPWPSNSLAFSFWENDLHSDANSALLFQWEHWLASFDDSTGLRTIYKNGLKVAEDISEATQTGTGGTIGTFNDAAWPFMGTIDDVRIYQRSLSAVEIQKLFYSEAFSDSQKSFLVSSPSVMGHYSQAEYSGNRTNGQTDVTTNPSAFNLFTQSQFDSNRTAGQNDVISNPMSYNLYTSDSIMDLRMGGLMIQKQGTDATIVFQPQTTTDLVTLPFTNNGTPITNAIPMPGDKGFLRVEAIYVPAGDLPSGY
jgi:hypothetical protein